MRHVVGALMALARRGAAEGSRKVATMVGNGIMPEDGPLVATAITPSTPDSGVPGGAGPARPSFLEKTGI